jgi:hypothetical protein
MEVEGHCFNWSSRSVSTSSGGEIALTVSNIGGTTFHSFIGAGLAKGEVADLVEMIRKTSALDEWTSTAALIIDESECPLMNVADDESQWWTVHSLTRSIRSGKLSEPASGHLEVCK